MSSLESILFNYETTNRTDYRFGQIQPLVKTEYRGKPPRARRSHVPLKDIHTLTDWKKAHVPFDLLIKPKDIVRTNPWNVQQPYEEPVDVDREQVQKTRPRLVMTPALSMDDISSTDARKILIEDMYTTNVQKAMAEGALKSSGNVQVPFPGTPAPANPITLPVLRPPYVSPEWRMDTVSWDNRQLRAKCDPDKEFYLARKPKCKACDVTAYLKSLRK